MTKEAKRFYLLVGISALVVGIFLTAFFLFLADDEESDVTQNVAITGEDKVIVQNLIQNFILTAGSWGVDGDTVTPETINDMNYYIGGEGSASDNYYTSRGDKYLTVRENFLVERSKLDYGELQPPGWSDAIAEGSLATFEVTDLEVSVPDSGYLFEWEGVRNPTVVADVHYVTKQTNRGQTATDTSWDGSWAVLEKNFISDIKVVAMKVNGEWRVYELRDQQHPFTLVTLGNPAEASNNYEASQFDFTPLEPIQTDIRESMEGPNE